MKIKKRDIEILIENLEELLAEMEDKEIDEIETSANTYGLSNEFISFGYNGYLDVRQAIEELVFGKNEEEY